jgi:hypothetical protein
VNAEAIKATQTLPEIVAITGMRDFGPCDDDGEPTAHCPHCGAGGRYVWSFICSDGSRRGAMRGCIKLFPLASGSSRYARLIQEAFDRYQAAQEDGKRLASWWHAMIVAAEEFGRGQYPDHDAIVAAQQKLYQVVADAEIQRQGWLDRNGYGRHGRRR